MEEVDSESEQIPGGGKQDVQSGHVVSKNTKCWLFFEVPPKGTTKSGCSLCGKSYKCVDGRNKLTTSTLKTHLLRQHGTNPQVRAAYLLDEAEKVTDATPRQTIVRYAKQMSKQEGQNDPYPRGSQTDLNTADAVEERNEDVEEVLESSGNIFEVEQSDFEDEDDELEFVDSFV